jgi:hypothetical protein
MKYIPHIGKKPLTLKVDVEKDNEPVEANYTHVDSWASSPLTDISTHQGTNKGVFKPS